METDSKSGQGTAPVSTDKPAQENPAQGRPKGEQTAVAVEGGQPPPPVVELSTLKDMGVTELTKIAKQLDVP